MLILTIITISIKMIIIYIIIMLILTIITISIKMIII